MTKTKIICTIGPASKAPETIEALLENGMKVARLNLAHGGNEDQRQILSNIKQASKKTGLSCAIMADLSGPEVRVVNLKEAIHLAPEQKIYLSNKESAAYIQVNHKIFLDIIEAGDNIIIGDGDITLKATNVGENGAELEVVNGGELKPNQRLTLLGKTLDLPPLTEKDLADIKWLSPEDIDFFALSFVRKASDIKLLKQKLKGEGSTAAVIAKIETREAIKNFEEILEETDAVMVARGDLGIELPPEDIPVIQKRLIRETVEAGKPVITATQMLESMVTNSRPTRAEVNDVANAIFDGTDAIMLSEETAIGHSPVEATAMMSRIAYKTEEAFNYDASLSERSKWLRSSPTVAISFASCELSYHLKAKAIVTATQSGTTARQVSKYRPKAPVVAVTPNDYVNRQLLLSWGVIPIDISPGKNIDEMFNIAVKAVQDSGIAKKGDIVIITAGVQVNVPGTTNLIKVQTVGE
jgi:pyruvate kinase